MSSNDRATDHLKRLAAELDDLRPTDGFTDAVMAAVEQAAIEEGADDATLTLVPSTGGSNGWTEGVWRSGVPAVVLAAMAAAACLLLSVQAQDDLDADVLATVDVVEVVE